MSELVIISAADEAALVKEMSRLVGFLDRVPGVSLSDVAYTCSLSRGASVISIIASDTAELRARIVSAMGRISAGSVRRLRD